jgi:hypothetical protein
VVEEKGIRASEDLPASKDRVVRPDLLDRRDLPA